MGEEKCSLKYTYIFYASTHKAREIDLMDAPLSGKLTTCEYKNRWVPLTHLYKRNTHRVDWTKWDFFVFKKKKGPLKKQLNKKENQLILQTRRVHSIV